MNTKKYKVAALCGSLRKASVNMGLLRKSFEIAKDKFDFVFVDLSKIPLYNMDDDTPEKFPDAVKTARSLIADCEAVLIGLPEFNYSVPGSFKNAIDWLSRPTIGPHPFGGKPCALISAGGMGGYRSQQHFRQIGQFLDLHFMNNSVMIRHFEPPQKFDASGDLIDPDSIARLKKHLEEFYDWVAFHKK